MKETKNNTEKRCSPDPGKFKIPITSKAPKILFLKPNSGASIPINPSSAYRVDLTPTIIHHRLFGI